MCSAHIFITTFEIMIQLKGPVCQKIVKWFFFIPVKYTNRLFQNPVCTFSGLQFVHFILQSLLYFIFLGHFVDQITIAGC